MFGNFSCSVVVLRAPNVPLSSTFSHKTIVRACKPASFWQEKCDTVFILVQGFAKNVVVSKQFTDTVVALAFFDHVHVRSHKTSGKPHPVLSIGIPVGNQ